MEVPFLQSMKMGICITDNGLEDGLIKMDKLLLFDIRNFKNEENR